VALLATSTQADYLLPGTRWSALCWTRASATSRWPQGRDPRIPV